ncbi:MAG: hypothetical protein KF812_08570 [Fimbriimonadaceae bacterium]|nr:hypothetical protein [Fimbriimonadaceae bacterium]
MKHFLWVMAGLAVFAGIAANRGGSTRAESLSVQQTNHTPAPSTEVRLEPEMGEVLPFFVGIAMDVYLRSAAADIQTPVGERDTEFGLERVEWENIGPHPLYYSLVSFGNATERFDPNTWRSVMINDEGDVESADLDKKEWDEPVAKASKHFLQGRDLPVRWESSQGYFEARPVRLNLPSCLNCHTESKVGDIAAILVYNMTIEDTQDEWFHGESETPTEYLQRLAEFESYRDSTQVVIARRLGILERMEPRFTLNELAHF